MRLTFKTLPLSTNQMYRTSGRFRYLTNKAKECKAGLGWEARAQFKGSPLTGPVAVKIALYWPDRRNRDVDNIKCLLDALTGICWVDDGQIVELLITKAYDKENPRVELLISPS